MAHPVRYMPRIVAFMLLLFPLAGSAAVPTSSLAIPALPPPPGSGALPAIPLPPSMQATEQPEAKKEEAKAPITPPAIPTPGGADKVGATIAAAVPQAPAIPSTTAPATAPTTTPSAPAENAAASAPGIPPLPAPPGTEQASAGDVPPLLPPPPVDGEAKDKEGSKDKSEDNAKEDGEGEFPSTSLQAKLNASPTGIVLPPAPKLPKVHLHTAGRQKTWETKLKPVMIARTINFNYKRQVLPGTIYRTEYDADNRHLPVAVTSDDYRRWFLERVANNDIEATRALLNAGSDPNTVNAEGNLALVVALNHGAVDTARLLMARGANPYNPGPAGVSAYDVAAQTGQLWLIPRATAAR